MNPDRIKIFTGTSRIPRWRPNSVSASALNWGKPNSVVFSDGEINLQILENVRGADVFVVQPTCTPVDEHLMELLVMIHALRLSSARRITSSATLLWVRSPGS